MPWNLLGRKKQQAALKAKEDEFIAAYRAALARAGVKVQSWGIVAVENGTMILWIRETGKGPPPDAYQVIGVRLGEGEKASEISFANLRPRFAQVPAPERAAFLDFTIKAHLEADALPGSGAQTLDQVRDRLLPVVRGPFPPKKGAPPHLALVEGFLHVYLVVDAENSVRYVSPDDYAAWGKSLAELLPLARENLRKRSAPSAWQQIDQAPGVLFHATNDAYDASRALLLPELVQPWPEEGVVVTIPHRDLLLCLPLRGLDALKELTTMAGFSRKLFQEEGYGVSDQPYWFDGRTWERIPVAFEKKGARITPSERFTHALVRLGGAGAASAAGGERKG